MDNKRSRFGKRKRKNNAAKAAKNQGRQGYEDIVKENANLEKYYKLQGIIPPDEWDSFMEIVKQNLPVSFRITGSKNHAKALLKLIQSEYFDKLIHVDCEEEEEKLICLPWYPENLAWQLNLSRKSIRKDEIFTKLHSFLVYETNSGNISRQEVVSMIPPLLLDVQPHHRVLDMCAAPGSKTAQLIEMLHANDTVLPEGMLIANDVDNKRCYMLVHQAKRLQSPCFLITNHDASSMPNIRMRLNDEEVCNLKYDRVLCDVPCSGDGTLRKNYDVWLKWNVANGNNLHGLQYRIARRGLELLAVNGRLVYSTCSMNPIEDEAVVHNLLVQCEGSVELVDVSNELPGLKYSKGVSKWVVTNRDLECFSSYEDVPEKFRTQIRPNFFPPNPENAEKFHLNRCMRILPHHQNTGGFFVAVFRKIELLPGERTGRAFKTVDKPKEVKEENSCADSSVTGAVKDKDGVQKREIAPSSGNGDERSVAPPPRKKAKIYGYREDPFCFFKADEPTVWPSIRDFYKIDSTFDFKCLLTRCETGKKRNLYFVTPTVKEVISNNEDRIKVINTGVVLFRRNDSKGSTSCNFRLTQEGLQTILPFIGSRRVTVTRDDLILLLSTDFPFNSKMSQSTRQQLNALETGCVALLYEMESKDDDNPLTLGLCGWKGASTTRGYVPKAERVHYLQLCGADVSRFDKKFLSDAPSKGEMKMVNETGPDDDDDEGINSNNSVVSNIEDKKTKPLE